MSHNHYDFVSMPSAGVQAGPAPAVTIRHIEVVQTIQDEENSIPLIANKSTVLRLYLDGTGSGVTGEIAWSNNGGSESFLAALNKIELRPSAAEPLMAQRHDLSKSLNFLIPAGGTSSGKLKIRVTRIFASAVGNLPLMNPGSLSASFVDSAPLRVRVIGLRYLDAAGTSFSPDAVHFAYLHSYLQRAYPVAQVEWSQIVVDANFKAPFNADTVLRANAQVAAIRSREVSSGIDMRTHYYGLVSDGNGANFMRGRAFDIPGVPRPDVVASGPAGMPRGFAGDQDLSYADWYGAHELGHTFGRFHPGFPVGAQDASDPDFPYPDGLINKPGLSLVGFDVGDGQLALPMVALSGESHHDIMTYAENQWVSAYTYLAIMNRIQAEQALGSDPEGEF